MSIDETELKIEQKVAIFSQQADWITVDSYIDYVGVTQGYQEVSELTYNDNNNNITLSQSFFSIFDYIPNTEITLIASKSLKDIISIKSESNVNIKATYTGIYNIPISNNYPKICYIKQNSSESWKQANLVSVGNNDYAINLSLDYGTYKYYIVADNENYPNEYISPTKTFVVTERPHSFVNLNPNLQDGIGNSNTVLNFSWNATKGVEGDILKYTLFLGTSEDSMQRYNLEKQNSYIAYNLSPRTRYYWKVEVENQYGAKLLNPKTFNFVTLGEIKKMYNAPNPFNPLKEKTRIFFEMYEDGNIDLDVYSEYGDKIYHTSRNNLSKGNNEIVYDGKDDYGNTLYNGTYLCIVKKKYSGTTKTERCRLLVIK
jgi:hypothetical protein